MAEIDSSSSRGVVQGLGLVATNQVAAAPLPESVQGFKSSQIPELKQSDSRVSQQVEGFILRNQPEAVNQQIESFLQRNDRELSVSFDDSTGFYVARVLAGGSEAVVRQVPSEEMLRIARNIDQMRGRLVDIFA
jgi:flagellar protein FlaG